MSNMVAGVRLPAGALIQSIELEGCDTGAGLNFLFALYRAPSPSGTASQVAAATSTGTPGCGFFSVAPSPSVSPLVVDNENNTYFITYFIQLGAPNAMAAFAGGNHQRVRRWPLLRGRSDHALPRWPVFLSLALGLNFAPQGADTVPIVHVQEER
jgi:hypothetical protein